MITRNTIARSSHHDNSTLPPPSLDIRKKKSVQRIVECYSYFFRVENTQLQSPSSRLRPRCGFRSGKPAICTYPGQV